MIQKLVNTWMKRSCKLNLEYVQHAIDTLQEEASLRRNRSFSRS